MLSSAVKYLQDGQTYMKHWPMEKQLYPLFPECRIIAATKFGIQVAPPIGLLMATLQYHYLGVDYIAQIIATALFFISLPVQGLVWLGHRSNQTLPPSIKAWYVDIYSKMQAHGCTVTKPTKEPKFLELARFLKQAFKQLDKSFTRQLF